MFVLGLILGSLITFFTMKRVFIKKILQVLDQTEEKEVEELLDPYLNQLVDRIKKQIPGLGVFLSNSLVERVRGIAKEELFLRLPEIKTHLKHKIQDKF